MAGNQTPPTGAGRVLGGRYRLVSPIARGGMADVWEGYDVVLSRAVAVKVLQAHLAEDDLFLERFRREAVTAARLSHPGIVSTFDTGLDHGTAYIVMELVRGRNLRQYMSDTGPMPAWQAVTVARQVADALAYAHQAGLVHRDIKPANVLLVEDEWGGTRVKVTDFGIAKAGEAAGADLTRTGMVLGTPKYLSPEQIRGQDPDARVDLYSLGVVLFEMLAGAPPYVGETDMATALAHLNDKVPKVSSRVGGVPSGLDRLVSDLLAKDPDKRVGSAIVVRQRLDALGPLSGGTSKVHGGPRRGLGGRRTVWGSAGPATSRPGGPVPSGPSAPGPGAPAPGGPVPFGATQGASARRPSTPTGFPYDLDPVVHPASPPVAPAAAGNPGPPVSPPVAPVNGQGAPGLAYVPLPGAQRPATQPPGPLAPGPLAPGPQQPGAQPRGAQAGGARAVDVTVQTPPAGPPPARSAAPATAVVPRTRVAGPAATPAPEQGRGEVHPTRPARRSRRSERFAGGVVLTVVALGAIVAGVLYVGQRSSGGHSPTDPPVSQGLAVSAVTVFMANGRPPDDPAGTAKVIDGNALTYWSTDPYPTATFGSLYPGIGLDIQLSSAATLHHLKVVSPDSGWTAQTFVSAAPISSGQAVNAWGLPTDTRTSTSDVTTFTLHGHKGDHVLFWLTNLGPPRALPSDFKYQARIEEISVT